jgi:hypothetical protein
MSNKKPVKSLSKASWIVIALLVLNAAGFSGAYVLHNQNSQQEVTVEAANLSSDEGAVDYLNGGWRMLNWGAKLLKYFKENEPQN